MGVTQVRGRAGCGGHLGEGCLGQSGSGRKGRRSRYPHFADEGTEVQGRKGPPGAERGAGSGEARSLLSVMSVRVQLCVCV